MRNVGVIGKSSCRKPVYKDGLCAMHYRRMVEKQKPWSERENYRPASIDELSRGCSLKLATENTNRMYKVVKDVVLLYNSKIDKWIETQIPVDHTLFVVKTI